MVWVHRIAIIVTAAFAALASWAVGAHTAWWGGLLLGLGFLYLFGICWTLIAEAWSGRLARFARGE